MTTLSSKQVFVVGCGAAGFSAALSLADLGWNVKILERDTLGSGSTGRNPGRMGLGLHYADLNTALTYLRASFNVQWKYPGYLIGQGARFARGRYYITKDTTIPKETILATYETLKTEYSRLIAEKAIQERISEEAVAARTFGSPDDFYRILAPNEISPSINLEKVDIAVESAEHLFNWPAFSEYIKKVVMNHPNIELMEHAEVIDVQRGEPGSKRYTLFVDRKIDAISLPQRYIYQTDYVVNSTFDAIGRLNAMIGIHQDDWTNRLKCILVAKLPPSLQNENSGFFCMGEHCMFSNMGNGYGMMTYAKTTNMEVTQEYMLSNRAQQLIRGEATTAEKNQLGQEILSGVAEYIPEMAAAEIVDVKFGIVRTEGRVTLSELHSATSSINKRDYTAVEVLEEGWVASAAIKLFYFLNNGQLVADALEKQFYNSAIRPLIDDSIQFMSRAIAQHTESESNDFTQVLAEDFHLVIPCDLELAKKYIAEIIAQLHYKIELNLRIESVSTIQSNKDGYDSSAITDSEELDDLSLGETIHPLDEDEDHDERQDSRSPVMMKWLEEGPLSSIDKCHHFFKPKPLKTAYMDTPKRPDSPVKS